MHREPPPTQRYADPARFRFGLLLAKIGASFSVRLPGGRPQSLPVYNAGDYPDAPRRAICLTCLRTWSDADALERAHNHEALKRAQSAHVWCFFSKAPLEPLEVIPPDATDETRLAIEMRNARSPTIGLMSTESWSTPAPRVDERAERERREREQREWDAYGTARPNPMGPMAAASQQMADAARAPVLGPLDPGEEPFGR